MGLVSGALVADELADVVTEAAADLEAVGRRRVATPGRAPSVRRALPAGSPAPVEAAAVVVAVMAWPAAAVVLLVRIALWPSSWAA
jgi:hypothetical protein